MSSRRITGLVLTTAGLLVLASISPRRAGAADERRASPVAADTSADRPAFRRQASPRRGLVSDHVVVISVDGLRPDAIARFEARTIMRLVREGRSAESASTILPSKTLPSHTSMLTGEDVDKHGIAWNSNQTGEHGHVAVPTVFGLARAEGFRTAAFFSKGKFNHLEVPGSLDYSQAPNGDGRWSADRTAGDVERYLATERPNLLFVHFGEPDYAGHLWGWMSWLYGRGVRKADDGVARVLAAADGAYGVGQYTVILTADHGGHGRNHGSSDSRDTTIPWITWGKGVQSGSSIPGTVRTMDTAGTALWLLGVNAPEGLAGVPVRSAFLAPAYLADETPSGE
jgi:arylsulfatase A-like enzyme